VLIAIVMPEEMVTAMILVMLAAMTTANTTIRDRTINMVSIKMAITTEIMEIYCH
jgi:hypothetical protein